MSGVTGFCTLLHTQPRIIGGYLRLAEELFGRRKKEKKKGKKEEEVAEGKVAKGNIAKGQ